MQPDSSAVSMIPTRERNRAALVLFGRAAVTTLGIVSGVLGFLTGIELQRANYNPYSYATGVGALFAAACAVIAFLLMRRRLMADNILRLEAHVAELSDCVCELREAEQTLQSARDHAAAFGAVHPAGEEAAKTRPGWQRSPGQVA
jgi:hypothetical protein